MKNFIQQLQDRIKNFIGYGNLNSKIWFVGIEEHCGDNIEELENRIRTTSNLKVLDIVRDMPGIDEHLAYFRNGARIQKTWRGIIKLIFAFEGRGVYNNNDIRNFQINELGRLNSRHALLEFLPLPNPGTNQWMYNRYGIDYLRDREGYEQKIYNDRVSLFKDIIGKEKPEIVIFYSMTYHNYWEQIMGDRGTEDILKYERERKNRVFKHVLNGTKYFVIPHMTRLSNEEINEIGNMISQDIKS